MKYVIFAATGLTNEGKIAGYSSQGGPYSLWLPDSGNVIIDKDYKNCDET